MQKLLITGGAGFIGSCFVRRWIEKQNVELVNFDLLTYAGHLESLEEARQSPRHTFVQGDICDSIAVERVLLEQKPNLILHLAAETHVDRSIEQPAPFVATNVAGTATLLETTLRYWQQLGSAEKEGFRLLHVSTDEVYGPTGSGQLACEGDAYAPTSPYAASKAAADQLVRAYGHTYGLPVMIAHPTNNYGPYQFPEKLIPHFVFQSMRGESLPLYGDGQQQRDWLFVEDHCAALEILLAEGKPGESYHVGTQKLRSNREVAENICAQIDKVQSAAEGDAKERIVSVADRPAHDHRYALDCTKMQREFGWSAKTSFDDGLQQTVEWYLKHPEWIETVRGDYQGQRMGLL